MPRLRSVVVAVATLAILVPAARAATGDLTLHQCLYAWAGGDAPCVEQDLLTQPQNVVVAPDGRDVYVLAPGTGSSGAIVGLRRDATTGDLTESQCFTDYGSSAVAGCTQVAAGSVLTYPRALALSPDGSSLYVLSGSTAPNGGVSRFARDPATGTLVYKDCIADPNVAGHNCGGSSTLGSIQDTQDGGIAVTPDGKDVIVMSGARSAVTWIPRNTTDGSLSPAGAGCLGDGTVAACTTVAPLYDVSGVGVSPDGKNVYATTWSTAALVHLTRNTTTGALALGECFANNPGATDPAHHTASCSAVTPAVLTDAANPVVSPDGKTLVDPAAAGLSNWTLNANGIPAFTQCFGNSTTSGCTITPPGGNGGMGGTLAAAFSPDNLDVYSAAYSANVLTTLARDAAGSLTFNTCLAQTIGPKCPSVIAQAMEFQTPYDVAVSPDGLDVYTVSQGNHGALLHFQREVPGGRPSGAGGGGGGTPPPTGGGGGGTPPPTGTGSSLPKFATLVTLPSARSCARRSSLTIRLHIAASLKAKSATIVVNGRRVAVRKGKQLRKPFALRSLPTGITTIVVQVVLPSGKVVGSHRYPTCKKH